MREPVHSRSSRGPGVFDLILLIAAMAAAMGFLQVFLPWYGNKFDSPWKVIDDMKARGPLRFPFHITYWVQLASPFLWCGSLAMIPIRIRRPRPSWRRMMRQPGAVASLSASIAMLTSLAAWGLLAIPSLFGNQIVAKSLIGTFYPMSFRAYMFAQTAIGYAIVAAWGVLAVSGRWQPEPSWVDRSGRLLGFVWIVILPLNLWSTLIIQ